MKSKIRKIVFTAILIYIISGIGLYLFQRLFVLHPQNIGLDHKLDIKKPFVEYNFKWLGSENFNLVKIPSSNKLKGIVLYLHGNKRNIERYAPYTDIFTNNGYDVWMPDYPAFGKTTGNSIEENFYKAALLAYDTMSNHSGNLPIIIYGKSLGTGLANYVASKRNCKAVILETPYYSIPSLFHDWVYIYPMEWLADFKIYSYKFFMEAQKPTVIFHGTNDWVIPYRNASRFKQLLKPTDTFITINGADHVNINKSAIYLAFMKDFLNK